MRSLDFFETHPVFTHGEFVSAHGSGGRSKRTSNNLLARHLANGRLLRVRRGLYATVQRGIDAEFIDPRTLAPLEQVMEIIIASVKKTGRLLTSDDGSYSFCNCTEIIARVAETVPGAKFKRLAFPDAPPPGAPEMINYMRVNASDIVAAAEKMVRA